MALVHLLYVGHFIPEQGFVRVHDHKLAVTRPLNMPALMRLLTRYLEEDARIRDLPERWTLTLSPDYMVCDLFGAPVEALRFAADYAEQEGATLVDMGAFALLTPEQLRQSASQMTQARPA